MSKPEAVVPIEQSAKADVPQDDGKDEVAPTPENIQAGFCSATCVDRESLQNEVKKPPLKTSDLLATCHLPKRFEYPQTPVKRGNKQGKFFVDPMGAEWFDCVSSMGRAMQCRQAALCKIVRRSGKDWFNGYGCQVSKQHPFYRTSSSEYGWYPPGIHSVPSVFFPAGQTFTNHLAAAGMYRNYSLNTGMDQAGF